MSESYRLNANSGESILEVSRNVVTVFTRCRLKPLEKYIRSELENEMGRFKIWGGNLGVFAPGNASADYRLRDDPDVREVIIQMLDRLRQHIKQAIDPPILEETSEGGEHADNTDSDSSSQSSVAISLDEDSDAETDKDIPVQDIARKAILEIKAIMTRLYRLSAIIRMPSSSRENVKVANFIAKQERTEEMKEFESSVRWQIQFRHPNATPSIIERLVNAAIFRRMKLQYRERHQEKLNQGVDEPSSLNQQVTAAVVETVGKAQLQRRRYRPMDNNRVSSVKGSMRTFKLSATDASSVNRLKFASYPKSVSLSGITKSAVQRREGMDVPPPPSKDHDESKEAICPYCFRIVEKEEMMQPRWGRHILRDIEPYVCLFNNCDKPHELYKTIDEWVNHMQWQHALVWSCQATGHESAVYYTEEEFKVHLLSDHKNAFDESQLPVLIEKGAKPGPDIFSKLALMGNDATLENHGVCILCPFNIDEPAESHQSDFLTVEPTVNVRSKKIRDHIATHLEEIALLSLPERDDLDDATTNERESDGTKPSIQEDQDLPSLELIDESPNWSSSEDDDENQIPDKLTPGGLEDEWAFITADERVNQTLFPQQSQDPTLREFVKRARQLEILRKRATRNVPTIIVYDPDGLEINFNDPNEDETKDQLEEGLNIV
ncbi:hypothetical protein F5884DRAFT_886872 [Xylogone sp. PMI_703]|nr:hypothetical protein F5884DRAFT_886872 [Xylogone sp. PMI_703]